MTETEAEVEPTPVMPSSVSTSTNTGAPLRSPFETTLTSVIFMTAASPVATVRASLPAPSSDCQFNVTVQSR